MNAVGWRNLRPLTSLGLILTFFLTGCGTSLLLDQRTVEKMSAPPDDEPHVIYYHRAMAYTPEGTLLDTTYSIIRLGVHAKEFPRVLMAAEDANSKILDVEGRVIHTDGSSSRVGMDDFFKVSLSSGNFISEKYVRTAAIPDRLQKGDVIETVSLIQRAYPQLGIEFSPADLGFAADNVRCTIQVPIKDSLQYAFLDVAVTPDIQSTPLQRRYVFQWGPVRRSKHARKEMAKRNIGAEMYAALSSESWKSLGDWYLALIGDKLQAGTALADTARRITQGKTTPTGKLDAIFEYCQRSIRYEQVYLAHGEYIPNAADLVFTHRFGDCKDYATLMHAMAKSVGVETQLALCYRGRGIAVCRQVPAMQFNHMILHFDDGGKDRWYDATDRLGVPGSTSFDLANAPAFILEQGRSRLATIEESPDNLMAITGTLSPSNDRALAGHLRLTFSRQYATEFSWNAGHLNPTDMKEMLNKEISTILNDDIHIDSTQWEATPGVFSVDVACKVPNATTALGEKEYVSASRLFPNLLPDDIESDDVRNAYFFPFFNNVGIDVLINAGAPFPLVCHYQIPGGPFDDASRAAFLTQLGHAWTPFTHTYLLTKGSR